MACHACPYAFTNESEAIQGLGCLPSPFEANVALRDKGLRWECHEKEGRPCAGQAVFCREEKMTCHSGMPIASYAAWSETGEFVAAA